MALSKETRESLKIDPPPATTEVRKRTQDWIARTGIETGDLAAEINYSRVALLHFLHGRYSKISGNDANMRRALTEYLDAHPDGDDEDALPKKLIPTRDTRLALECADEALRGRRLIALEGPAGTGKTTVLQWFAARNPSARFYLRLTRVDTPRSILQQICRMLRAYSTTWGARLLRNAVRRLREGGTHRVLLIDEAQYLLDRGCEGYDLVKDIYDLSRCGIVLAGHFTFLRHVSNGLGAELEPHNSRIQRKVHLRGLQESELLGCVGEFLGGELPKSCLSEIIRAITAKDRAAHERARLCGLDRGSSNYFSMRRLKNLCQRAEEIRAIPENAGKSIEQIVRAAARELVSAERSPV